MTVDRIAAAVMLDRMARVLSVELKASGDPLLGEDGPDPDTVWGGIVDRLAPSDRILTGLRAGIDRELERLAPSQRAELAQALGFLESTHGRRAMAAALDARTFMTDPESAAEARDGFARAAALNHPRAEQARRLVAAADLIEPAVARSLNLSLATLQGIQTATDEQAPDDWVIEDVWLMEPEIRAEQAGGVEALCYLAIAPLAPAEVDQLISHAAGAGSRRLAAILDAATVTALRPIARDLGRAAALRQSGQPL